MVFQFQPVDRGAIDALLVAAALRADAVAHLSAREVEAWLRSVILAAAEQVETVEPSPGRAVTVETLLRVLDRLADELRAAKAPRSVLEAISSAHATVARLADQSAIETLRQVAPGYLPPRDLPAPDVSQLLSTFAVSDALGVLDSLVGDRRELAQYLSSQLAAATLSGIGPRDLVRLVAERLADVARYRIERAVRTELLRTLAARQIAHYASTPGIERWRWNATLDSRTCGVCWTLHGQMFEFSQPMIRHPNCRCVPAPVSTWALRDPEMRAELERDTGWARLAAMSDGELERVLGPGRARLVREFGLLEKPEGWRALLRVRRPTGAPPSVAPVTIRSLESGNWGDFRIPEAVDYAALKLVRAAERLPGMTKRATEYLRRYADKRLVERAETLDDLLERGRLIDRALTESSPAYRTFVERTRALAQRMMEIIDEYKSGRTLKAFVRWDIEKAEREFSLTPEQLMAMRRDVLRFLGALRRFQGPVLPYREIDFEWADAEEKAQMPRLMRHWRFAFSFFPRAWSERLAGSLGLLTIASRPYNSGKRIGVNYVADDQDLVRVFVHELAHQHENYNERLTRFMIEFFEYRRKKARSTALYPLKDFYPLSDDDEMTTLLFPYPYGGKLYRRYDGSQKPSEIISTAMEGLFGAVEGGALAMIGDDEVRAWLLGVLVEV